MDDRFAESVLIYKTFGYFLHSYPEKEILVKMQEN